MVADAPGDPTDAGIEERIAKVREKTQRMRVQFKGEATVDAEHPGKAFVGELETLPAEPAPEPLHESAARWVSGLDNQTFYLIVASGVMALGMLLAVPGSFTGFDELRGWGFGDAAFTSLVALAALIITGLGVLLVLRRSGHGYRLLGVAAALAVLLWTQKGPGSPRFVDLSLDLAAIAGVAILAAFAYVQLDRRRTRNTHPMDGVRPLWLYVFDPERPMIAGLLIVAALVFALVVFMALLGAPEGDLLMMVPIFFALGAFGYGIGRMMARRAILRSLR